MRFGKLDAEIINLFEPKTDGSRFFAKHRTAGWIAVSTVDSGERLAYPRLDGTWQIMEWKEFEDVFPRKKGR